MAVLSEAQYTPINVAASGPTQLVAGVAGAKIRVLGFFLITSGTVSVKLVSGASPDLTGAMSLAAGKWISNEGRLGAFETAVAAALNINLSAAIQVSGWLVFCTAS